MTNNIRRYSEAFRMQVVAEYEAGSSISELQKKYGITGGQTIQTWIRKYAKEGLRHDVVRIQIADEINRIKDLEKQVQELEQALGKVTLEKLKLESILEVFQGNFPEDAKKNVPRSSKGSSRKQANNQESK